MIVPRVQHLILTEKNYPEWAIWMEAYLTLEKFANVVLKPSTKPTGPDTAISAYEEKISEARAAIILHLDPSQFSHIDGLTDPNKMWEALKSVHVARGIGSRLAMMRRFVNMRMTPDQDMENWIAQVRHAAQRLKQNDGPITDMWVILAATNGLRTEYHDVVESLDSVDTEKLTLDYVTNRLLNAGAIIKANQEHNAADETAMAAASKRFRMENKKKVRCYNCSGNGHIASDCPSPPSRDKEERATSAYVEEDEHAF